MTQSIIHKLHCTVWPTKYAALWLFYVFSVYYISMYNFDLNICQSLLPIFLPYRFAQNKEFQ